MTRSTDPRNKNQGHSSSGPKSRDNRSSIISTAKTYGYALINNDETKLDDMTLYTQGTMGSSQSNVSAFKKSGASRIKGVQVQGSQAIVLFGKPDSSDVACIGVFNVLGSRHIMGDWQLFQRLNA